MDPYRLPRHIVPTRYDIRLEPDLTTRTFQGDETISLTVRHPASEVVLNAAGGLEILEDAKIENDLGASQVAFETSIEEEEERWRFKFHDPLAPGKWQLRLRFQGLLTARDGKPKLEGFYLSTYKDISGEDRMLATTQFESTAARQAFPCWDEPAFKAVFAATLVIDRALKAVSNTTVLDEYLEGDKKVICFEDTIPMSTYLVAFVVGDLEATKPVWVDRTPLRIWYVPDAPSKSQLAAFGQQIGEFSLAFFEKYYGQPYPGRKLDLLAIPDFAAGAMENLGAITFRQTRVLVNKQEATHTELEAVGDTVAHENAHMWFGDLVTMAWWDDLWLNEAFATFMEILAVDGWKPEWHRWTTFGLTEREVALAVDGLHSTRPIEFRAADDPRDIEAMFDALTYRKGASVLRMVEQYLDPEVFRAGIRDYLHRHAFSNAKTADLWTALGEAAGRDISELMNCWIRQPGFPLIIARHDETSQQLVLTQQRFRYLEGQPILSLSDGAQNGGVQDQLWQVPVQLRTTTKNGETTLRELLLTGVEKHVDLPENFESARINESGHGFYRVHYDGQLRELLLNQLPSLSPIERLNLVKDDWAVALAESDTWRTRPTNPLTEFLKLAGRLAEMGPEEAAKNLWAWAILIQSFYVLNRVISTGDRPDFEKLVRDLIEPTLQGVGWKPKSGESELIPQLRADLLRTLGTLGDHHGAQDWAAEIYSKRDGTQEVVDGNIVAAAIQILAHVGDEKRYEEFFNKYRSIESTPQDKERYVSALAAFRQPGLLQSTLAKTIEPEEIRPQDAPFVVRPMLMSVYGREHAWQFVKDHWEEMGKLYRQNGLNRVCAGLVGLTTPELESDVEREVPNARIEGQTLQQFLGGKALEQYLEQLRVFGRFRERNAQALHDSLHGHL